MRRQSRLAVKGFQADTCHCDQSVYEKMRSSTAKWKHFQGRDIHRRDLCCTTKAMVSLRTWLRLDKNSQSISFKYTHIKNMLRAVLIGYIKLHNFSQWFI